MSLNSVSARKKQHSAHNSPRSVKKTNSGAAATPSGGSKLEPNVGDVEAVNAAIAASSVTDGDDSPAKELFPPEFGSVEGPKSPSYQEKLEARITNPVRFRPKSARQKLTVQPADDRSTHRVTIKARPRLQQGEQGAAEATVGQEVVNDKGQVSFLSSMALRIKSLEAANRSLRVAVVGKEKQCLQLQHELHEARREDQAAAMASMQEEIHDLCEDNDRLADENEALRAEVREFHAFLQDHGLQWCGGASDRNARAEAGENEETVVGSEGSGLTGPPTPGIPDKRRSAKNVDFDALFVALAKLNQVAAEDNERKVTVVGKTAVFAPEKPVQLTFYADGFVVGEDEADQNAFRSFTDSPAAHEFIRDVLDGFFPWEFNESHPEGVQFSWKDFRSRRCPFSSKGYSLLDSEPVSDADPAISLPERSDPGATTPQRKQQSLAQLGGPVLRVTQTAQATDGIPQSPMSAVQSALDKIPKHDARVAEIRNQIANELLARKQSSPAAKRQQRHGHDFVVVTTKLVEQLSKSDAPSSPAEADKKGKTATLQVRTLDGKQTLILKMWASDTVSDVHAALTRHLCSPNGSPTSRADSAVNGFNLHSQYPRRILTVEADGEATLKEIGLTPKATLRMVRDPAAAAAFAAAQERREQQQEHEAASEAQKDKTIALSGTAAKNASDGDCDEPAVQQRSQYTAGHTITASPGVKGSSAASADTATRSSISTSTDAAVVRSVHAAVAAHVSSDSIGAEGAVLKAHTLDVGTVGTDAGTSTDPNLPRGSAINAARGRPDKGKEVAP